jgi:hypothetical protein
LSEAECRLFVWTLFIKVDFTDIWYTDNHLPDRAARPALRVVMAILSFNNSLRRGNSVFARRFYCLSSSTNTSLFCSNPSIGQYGRIAKSIRFKMTEAGFLFRYFINIGVSA